MADYEVIADGGSKGNPGDGYGSYQIVSNRTGKTVLERLQFGPNVTNNEAEYRAVIAALQDLSSRVLRTGRSLKEHSVVVQTDSNLVVNQVLGTWKVRKPHLEPYRDHVREMLELFGTGEIQWIPREQVEAVLGH